MKSIFCTVLIAGFPLAVVSAQTLVDSIDYRTEETYESFLEYGTQDVEDLQYAETLFQLHAERLDLNKATSEELMRIPSIDPVLAARIIAHRDSLHVRRVDDLVDVGILSDNVYKQIRGFLRVGKKAKNPSEIHFISRASRNIQERRGYTDGTYLGSPYKIYNRLIVQSEVSPTIEFEAGGVIEKDPGERSLTDFATGYLSCQTSSGSLRCVLGSYIYETGQGLVFWRSSGPTKGSEVIASVSKNPRGIQPCVSADENGFLRGIAIQARMPLVEITAFFSDKSINASLNDLGNISSLDASGLFRSTSELKKKSVSKERILGLGSNIWALDGFRLGLHGYHSTFGNALELSGYSGLRGRSASVAGVDYAITSQSVASFGELAVDGGKTAAFIGGVVLEPTSALAASVVVRSYPGSFGSLHGFGFGESGSSLQNERGVYTSARVRISSWLATSVLFDQFVFPGATTASSLPTSGHEFLMTADMTLPKDLGLQIQLKRKTRAEKQHVIDQFSRTVPAVGLRNQDNIRATFEWWSSSLVRWKSRLEVVRVNYSIAGDPSKGIMFFQDVRVKVTKGISVDVRAMTFDTDSYDARVYEFESDLRGAFSNPALSGKGNRFYVVLRCETEIGELSAKYACTIIPGARILGSGANEIPGDLDNQLSVQVDVQW